MRFTASFRDSDLVRFAHETDRRQSASRAPADSDRDDAMRLLRSPSNPRDKKLSSLAQVWCDGLPPELRPVHLCERYVRVSNRLALCWGDPVLIERLFSELLNERRGAQLRKGFPPLVQRELLALLELARRQAELMA
jgi:hypothetical protein